MRDEDGRGWIVVLVSLAGFGSVAVAITLSLPIWKPYFDKPRPGAISYHPVAEGAWTEFDGKDANQGIKGTRQLLKSAEVLETHSNHQKPCQTRLSSVAAVMKTWIVDMSVCVCVVVGFSQKVRLMF